MRSIRKDTGLTLEEFGRQIGCNASYLCQLENGKREHASDTFLLAIQAVFGIRREWLRTGQGEKLAGSVLRHYEADPEVLALQLNMTIAPIKHAADHLLKLLEGKTPEPAAWDRARYVAGQLANHLEMVVQRIEDLEKSAGGKIKLDYIVPNPARKKSQQVAGEDAQAKGQPPTASAPPGDQADPNQQAKSGGSLPADPPQPAGSG